MKKVRVHSPRPSLTALSLQSLYPGVRRKSLSISSCSLSSACSPPVLSFSGCPLPAGCSLVNSLVRPPPHTHTTPRFFIATDIRLPRTTPLGYPRLQERSLTPPPHHLQIAVRTTSLPPTQSSCRGQGRGAGKEV